MLPVRVRITGIFHPKIYNPLLRSSIDLALRQFSRLKNCKTFRGSVRHELTSIPVSRVACESVSHPHSTNQRVNSEPFEKFREYLNLLARMEVGPKYLRKVDPSAVVNATLFAAEKRRDELADSNERQLAAWLRQRLAYDLADAFRALHRDKRDIDREFSLEQSLANSDTRITRCLEAIQSSPSERAARHERSVRLAVALASLPDLQREAVELHHLQGEPISAVAEAMDRTNASVAGLLRRGLKRLRELLDNEEV